MSGRMSLPLNRITFLLLAGLPFLSALNAVPLKIMPLGDSRTAGPSSRDCYRLYLDRLMTANGYSFDFVGTQTAHDGGAKVADSVFDVDHQGMWGWTTEYMLHNPSYGWDKENIAEWTRACRPDIVLALLGTTDMFYYGGLTLEKRLDTIQAMVEKVIDTLRTIVPSVTIILANLYPVLDTTVNPGIVVYNSRLPAIVQAKNTTTSPVAFVDLWTGFDRGTDLVDFLHANQPGSIKIAQKFLAALWPFFSSTPPTSVSSRGILARPTIVAPGAFPGGGDWARGVFDVTGRLLSGTDPGNCIIITSQDGAGVRH